MKQRTTTINEILGRGIVHPFPARMAGSLALEAISQLGRPATVLDPMVGSGTVIAIARANGHRAIGYDVDPLAVLISRVWTRTVDPDELRDQARRVFARAKRRFAGVSVGNAYPISSDDETRAFVRYWFDGYVRRQLAPLSAEIAQIDDVGVREALWCAFSRMIIAKQAGVSLALDLTHSRPHLAFERAPRKPFAIFLQSVERVISGCLCPDAIRRGPRPRVEIGDARQVPLSDKSVELVFTSPPYLNAIDYLRCSKFSLVWMGYSAHALRRIRSQSIGTEVSAAGSDLTDAILGRLRVRSELTPRMAGILNRYIEDSWCAMSEVARVLSPAGRAVYVIGENTIRGTYIPTGELLTRVAGCCGLTLIDRRTRRLPHNRRYLPPPGRADSAFDGRIRREVILTFEHGRSVSSRGTRSDRSLKQRLARR